MRLPSTHQFTSELGILRTTVVLAYELLVLEGSLQSWVGRGTIVALDPRPCLSRSISQSGQKTRRYRLLYARLLGSTHCRKLAWAELLGRGSALPVPKCPQELVARGRLDGIL